MTTRAYLVVAVAAAVLLATIVRQVRHRRLRAKYALIWLGVAVAILPLAFVPGLLDWIAETLGVAYPPTLLLVLGLGFFALLSLHFSSELTRLEERTRRLAEETALMRYRLNESEPVSEHRDPGAVDRSAP